MALPVKRWRADGERQGTVAARLQTRRRTCAEGRASSWTAPSARRSYNFAAVDRRLGSGTLTGLQLPVFAMDFPMDPNSGFRGDSALNSRRSFIEFQEPPLVAPALSRAQWRSASPHGAFRLPGGGLGHAL